MKNKNTISILGMNRSGQHAVIYWLLAHIPEDQYCFCNNSYKINPFLKLKYPIKGNKNKEVKDYMIISYENWYIQDKFNDAFRLERDKYIGKTEKYIDIVIMRDSYNWVASAWKIWDKDKLFLDMKDRIEHTKKYIEKWKSHCYEYMGKSDYMKNEIFVIFNRWHTDKEYRKSIIEKLGLEFTDKNFNVLARTSSSFDDREKYQDRANDMKLNNRWEYYKNDNNYWDMFDKESKKLNKDIFKVDFMKEYLLNNDDIEVLKQYCTDKTVVELGTYMGGSAEIMAKFVKYILTVDTFPDYRPEWGYRPEKGLTYEDVKQKLSQYNNVEVIKGNAAKVGCNNSITADVLFIDDGHKFDNIIAQFYIWKNRVVNKGIVIFHDYIEDIEYSNQDVREAVNYLESIREIKRLDVRGSCFVSQLL